MDHPRQIFPDINIILTKGQKHRNILFLNNMSLLKTTSLKFSRQNLGNIMTQNRPHCLLNRYAFHNYFLPSPLRSPFS